MRKFVKAAVASAAIALIAFSSVNTAQAAVILTIKDVSAGTTITAPPSGFASGSGWQFTGNTTNFSVVNVTSSFLNPIGSSGPGIDLHNFTVQSAVGVGQHVLQVFITLTDLVSSGTTANLKYNFGVPEFNTPSTDTVKIQAWVNPNNNVPGTLVGALSNTSPAVTYTTDGSGNSTPSTSQTGTVSVSGITPATFFSMTVEVDFTLTANANTYVTSGDFSARLSSTSGPQISEGPEPASMAIWGLGLALAGGVRYVRRRQTAA